MINASPHEHTPVPKAAAALSPAPAATTVPALRPVSFAASSLICPATSSDSMIGGRRDLSILSFSKISSDHFLALISRRFVPDASDTSIKSLPVSLNLT